MTTIVEVNESGLKEDDPEIVTKMLGQKEGWVYTLTCLKGYLENGVNTLRAIIDSLVREILSTKMKMSSFVVNIHDRGLLVRLTGLM